VLGRLVMAARGEIPAFTNTGTNHPTRDGTGVRDYIHVWDLARAHVAAVEHFDEVIRRAASPSVVINVGTGEGVTVRELVAAFERVSGQHVRVDEAPPRAGDAVGTCATVDRAAGLLGWRAELSLDDAIASALAWGRRRDDTLGT
jgi:UDP-glucose 4-epimerase